MESKWRTLCLVQALANVVLLGLLWSAANEARPTVQPPESSPADEQADTGFSEPLRIAPRERGRAALEGHRSAAEMELGPVGSTGDLQSTVLIGRVVGSDGEPVTGAAVEAHRLGSSVLHGGIAADRDSAWPGRFAVPGLTAGRWVVGCRAGGYLPLRQELDLPATPVHSVDLVMRRAWVLKVRFVDEDGAPWPGFHRLSAVATSDEPPSAFPMTMSCSPDGFGVGEWQSFVGRSSRFAGQLSLEAGRPVWVCAVLRHRVLVAEHLQAERDEVELVVRREDLAGARARLRVRVLDAVTGAPVAGAHVSVSDDQSGVAGPLTDAEGRTEVHKIRPGFVTLSVVQLAYARHDRVLSLRAGEAFELDDIRMLPHRRIAGVVRGRNGVPLAGAQFTWVDQGLARRDLPMDSGRGASSAEDGKFSLGCGAGIYLVRIRHQEGVLERRIDTRAASAEGLDLQLSTSALVPIANHVPTGEVALVTLLDGQGRVVDSWLQRARRRGVQQPARLAPGRYTVEIRNRGEFVRSYPLDTTRPGATITVP